MATSMEYVYYSEEVFDRFNIATNLISARCIEKYK